MQRLLKFHLAAPAIALILTGCGGPTGDDDSRSAQQQGGPIVHDLVPLPGLEDAVPVLTQKRSFVLETTAGPVRIEVYPEAAPNAARRFMRLAESGYFNNTPVSRVVDNFVAQFGINWREPHKSWRDSNFDDDPSLFMLARGTLAFAKSGPNQNSTQVFINFKDNSHLASSGNFTVFGNVVAGMDVVDSFERVGDPSGGLDQYSLWAYGDDFLNQLKIKPTMIETVIVE